MKRKVELLSPAGDLERLKIALIYGADAVYIGGKDYSLRANANNFSLEEIKEACDFAHHLHKKVYLTLNIVFHNEDIDGVYNYIKEVYEHGIDAFIVSDLFIVKYIKDHFQVEVHLSTQDSTTNLESVRYLQKEGIDRVVLAREVGINDIKEIIDKTGMDIECFIHGAMCAFYSGRCVLSNYFTNRDSNRGGCAQVCRFNFKMNGEEDFSMAVKDLNMAYLIKDLLDINVKSLKIEGRMRSPYYLATVLSSYRRLIDNYYDNTLTKELVDRENKILSRVANRLNSTHYFDKEANITDQYYFGRNEISNQDYLAYVLDYDKKTQLCTVSQRNYFKSGDLVEIFTPKTEIIPWQMTELYNENMESIEKANHAEEIVKFKIDREIPIHSMIRRV